MGTIERQIAEQKLGYIVDPPLLPCPFCGHVARLLHDTHSDYERQWLWGVECQNYGECEASLIGFASKEAAIPFGNCRRVTYTHRNGETALPTEPGKYWFCGTCHDTPIAKLIPVESESGVLLAWRPMNDDGWYEYIEHFAGQWWGPVVAPWEQGA